jgi:hypothetical protein
MWIGQQVHVMVTPEVILKIAAHDTYLRSNTEYSVISLLAEHDEPRVDQMIRIHSYQPSHL